VAAAQAKVRAARAGLDAARGAYRPEVGLSASAADHRETLSGEAGQVWQVAARATWALADGGRRGAGVAAGRARLRAAEAERARVRHAVRADVVSAYTLREAAREQLAAARTEEAAAEAALGLVRDRYAAGAGLFTELREAEDRLAQAGLAALAARHDIAVAEADLRRAVGGDIGGEGP
jgi:outer membrane protein TolC